MTRFKWLQPLLLNLPFRTWERPVLVADALSLWAPWFIDDAILLFRSMPQTLRLLPQVVSMLADLGLTINVSKSCVLLRSLSFLPGCLAAYPLVTTSKYLGLAFGISAHQDEQIVAQLCGRATAAFFAKRPLLVNCRASFPSATAAPFPCPRYGFVSVVSLCFVRQARCPSASSCSLCHAADLVAGRSCSLCLV